MTRGSRVRKIFVSYSREGGQAHAVSLFQGLTQVLGEKAVFFGCWTGCNGGWSFMEGNCQEFIGEV